jgi:dTDP-glucose 4,6-dehydratase
MSRFLVTGGCGFAGSHLVEELVRQRHDVRVLDSLNYAGQLRNLTSVYFNFDLEVHDLQGPIPACVPQVDYVIHNAAESHVLRSLEDPGKFVRSNVVGTLNLLEWITKNPVKKFVYVSTDEVFGPAGDEPYHEGDRLRPTNPYSATKAGGEFLARSYFRSFGAPTLITRTVNIFGERQHPEKFVPKAIRQILRGETVDIHAHEGVIGSRQWVYAGEQAKALSWLAQNGEPGKAYHVSEGVTKTNLEIARLIAASLGKDLAYKLKEYAWSGHDLDYKISTRGTPEHKNWDMTDKFEELFTRTVRWYATHPEWLT